MFTHSYSRAIANVLQWINTISVLRWLQKHSDDEDVSSICWQRVPSCGTTDGGTANAKKSITFIALNKSSRCVIVVWVSGYFCRILLLDPSWHCHQEWKLTIVPHASVIELWLILGTSALFACPVSHLPLFLFFIEPPCVLGCWVGIRKGIRPVETTAKSMFCTVIIQLWT